jgi:hypothetical protein
MIFNNFTCPRAKIREIEEGIIMNLQDHLAGSKSNSKTDG